MSTKSKVQKRARAIQNDTGWSYSECLRLAREGISDLALDVLKSMRALRPPQATPGKGEP